MLWWTLMRANSGKLENRKEAIRKLGWSDAARAREALVTIIKNEQEGAEVRVAAIEAIARKKDDGNLPMLFAALSSTSGRVAPAAAMVIEKWGLLPNSDADRALWLAYLGRWTAAHAVGVDGAKEVLQAWSHSDERAQRDAVDQLASTSGLGAVPLLVQMFDVGKRRLEGGHGPKLGFILGGLHKLLMSSQKPKGGVDVEGFVMQLERLAGDLTAPHDESLGATAISILVIEPALFADSPAIAWLERAVNSPRPVIREAGIRVASHFVAHLLEKFPRRPPYSSACSRLTIAIQQHVSADFGYSLHSPIKCHLPAGEREYLARLRCPQGHEFEFKRSGSYNGRCPDCGKTTMDKYDLVCTAGEHKCELCFCMYHPELPEEPIPKGLTV